jgi:hypothetical protein
MTAAAHGDPQPRVARANFTALITSAAPAQRTIVAGWRSIMPFQTRRTLW